MTGRWAWVEVDLDAIRANVTLLRDRVAPAALWAVVKADGYGHGAVAVARAALEAGAGGLGVALVQEGAALRAAGIDASILLLSEQPPELAAEIVDLGLVPTVYTEAAIEAVAAAASARMKFRYPVHLKLDTGMHRVGASPADAVALSRRINAHPSLALAGTFTHLAVADEPADPFTGLQLDRFDEALEEIRAAGMRTGVEHAANSAGGLAHERARRGLVRAGIAIYGLLPGPGVADHTRGLVPALALKARVSYVKLVAAEERVSYGLRHRFDADTVVATLPLGYADGVPRRWSAVGGEVLVGGRRCPVVGVVTMDQLMVDCGPGSAVQVGDEAVLIGPQGDDEVTVTEWAERLGTISYEVVCALTSRLPRRWPGAAGSNGGGLA